MKKNGFIMTMANWFGTGNVPKLPGTIGTLGAVPLVIMVSFLRSNLYYMIFTALFLVFSIYISHEAEKEYGEKDAQNIVIDEVLGYLVTMSFVDLIGVDLKQAALRLGIGFILFRIFDITKLGPIQKVQGVKGGLGVVLDDLIAGIIACIILNGIIIFSKMV